MTSTNRTRRWQYHTIEGYNWDVELIYFMVWQYTIKLDGIVQHSGGLEWHEDFEPELGHVLDDFKGRFTNSINEVGRYAQEYYV